MYCLKLSVTKSLYTPLASCGVARPSEFGRQYHYGYYVRTLYFVRFPRLQKILCSLESPSLSPDPLSLYPEARP